MKKIMLIGILSLLIAGCDYKVSLVDNPNIDIDKSVIGLWQRTKSSGQTEQLLILPLSGQEYMVSFPAGTKNAIFARACLWRGSGMVLVQLDWFGTARGKLTEDTRTFQYAAYAVDKDSITVRLLNPQVIPKDVSSAKALAKAIADNKENPNLFRDAMVFQKVK
ncbi:MAG: hypothetical protein K9L78_02810 [Victivallales bacterium]|nr:hypothetical protein [Victivallales bacterium]MCF7889027.1 hypothetical protein [Victivallales bacterium]